MNEFCPACNTTRLQKKGTAIVRDQKDTCSVCKREVSSVDYLHTCVAGGKRCQECWRKKVEP